MTLSEKERYRLEAIRKKIGFIEAIIDHFGSITQALHEEAMGRAAIFMHLVAIAEQLDKLSQEGAYALLMQLPKEVTKGAYGLRNFVAHDYEGVNLVLVEDVLRLHLPLLRSNIDALLA
ncbi:MAG: DUF86 domain-containing protein [Campylobacterales bacterium]|nr:DUF86 domain-containing protein [Campylobacterales bacterium]